MTTAKKKPAKKGKAQRWLVLPTPTLLDMRPKGAATGEEGYTPELEHHGLTQEAGYEGDDEAGDRRRGRGPLGATNTRIPDPGGNPALYVSADDVAVRVGGFPIRNPTAASGLSIAPAAGAVVADTGPLAAGTYLVEINLMASAAAAAGKHIQVEHRDAANAANINVLSGCAGGQMFSTLVERVVVAANQRVRAIIGAVAFAASEGALASIRAYRLDV